MKTLIAVMVSCLAWSVSAQNQTYGSPGVTNVYHSPNAGTNPILAGPFTNVANGHFYYLLKSMTWTASEAVAVARGGHLVTINDAAENQWVVDTFAHYGGANRPLWIGLTDLEVEGTFEWSSGEPFNYANWNTASGEPNNSGGSGYEEDYVYIIQQNSGNPTVLATYWNDLPNDAYGVIPPVYGVIEINHPLNPPPPVVPPPVATVRLGCVEVCWHSMSNVQYQVEWRAAFASTNWFGVGGVVTGTGGEVCVTDTPHGVNRLYRVAVVLP